MTIVHGSNERQTPTTPTGRAATGADPFALDPGAEVARISASLRAYLGRTRRKGLPPPSSQLVEPVGEIG